MGSWPGRLGRAVRRPTDGIAGARIERVVAAAHTNKAQLYAYFGNKDGLFDAIFFGSLERIVNVVPIDAADLADWAVRLYDEYLQRPDLIRLATWARLERRPTGHLVDDTDRLDDRKLRAIAEAQAAGLIRDGDLFDLMAVVIASRWPGHRSATSTRAPRANPPTPATAAGSCCGTVFAVPWHQANGWGHVRRGESVAEPVLGRNAS